MHAYRRWLHLSLLALVLVFTVTACFNFIVDPYAIYGALDLSGINDNKNVATGHSRLVKPYLLGKIQPKGVILGSSRAEVGLDPGHPGWGRVQPVYNYAFGGISITELANRLQEAVAIAPVERALIGLDFYMFNAYLGDATETYRLKHDYQLYAKTLLTIDAVKASMESLRKNDPVEHPGLLPTGQVAWTFNDRRVRKYGHKNGFLRFEKHFMEDSIFPLPHKKFDFTVPAEGKDAFADFRRLLGVARENRIDMRFYISPVHVRLLMVLEGDGLWPKYAEWKKMLVQILAEEGYEHSADSFPLYDFSGVNSVTVEEVPVAGDTTTKMKSYWESSHFKKETGDLIQSKIFSVENTVASDFGVVLTPDNIDRHIENTAELLAEYKRNHPSDRMDIEKLLEESDWRSGNH